MNHEAKIHTRLAQEIRSRLLTARKNRWLRLVEKMALLSNRAILLERIRERLSMCACRGYDRAARICLHSAESGTGDFSFQMTRFLRGMPVDADVQFNILASELTCAA